MFVNVNAICVTLNNSNYIQLNLMNVQHLFSTQVKLVFLLKLVIVVVPFVSLYHELVDSVLLSL